MKRIISVILTFVAVFSLCSISANADITNIEVAKQYELWTQSPDITSGYTKEEIRLYKAMEMNTLHMYPLPQLGDKYFFAACEGRMSNTGKNGKVDLTLLYYYLILATDDGFIILDYDELWSSYYWDSGHAIADVSDMTVEPEDGSRVIYVIKPQAKYDVGDDWDDYNDYAFITEDKRMILEAPADEYEEGGCPIMYEGKMYWGASKYSTSSGTYLYYTPSGAQAMRLKEMIFSNDTHRFGTSLNPELSTVTAENGYTSFETFTGEIEDMDFYKIPGSDDLYFTLSYPRVSYYYYDQIDIYRNVNGFMEKIDSYQFSTTNGFINNYTVTELEGVDSNYYENAGSQVPVVDVGKKYIITNTGRVSEVSLDSSIYMYWNYALYNDRLVVIRNQNGRAYIYETDDGVSSYKQAVNYVNIDSNNKFTVGEDIKMQMVTNGNAGQNGYYTSATASSFKACTTFKTVSYTSPKEWFKRFEDNVFDDGRTVSGEWYYVGNYSELWYVVRNPDGTVCALGPTGHTVSSSVSANDVFCIAIGDSKFIAAVKDINSIFAREYYRVAVTTEKADGNVELKGTIGSKMLTPPEDTDTEPVQNVIDFGKDNLPLGYNIKDNVVSSEKLDSNVRERINAIRLNDIVIVKNSETSSGVQNTGITLDEYEEYDATMGDIPVVVYTNGQNFCWYCSDIDSLAPGKYSKHYSIGDKVIYVTFKIVKAPDSDGVTTVVF